MSPTDRDAPPEPGGCHVAAGCGEPACFQVWFEALMAHRLVGHWANACAEHIGVLVLDLRTSARACGLGDGQLTVFAIDPVAQCRVAGGDEPGPLWPGFAFSAFPVTGAQER